MKFCAVGFTLKIVILENILLTLNHYEGTFKLNKFFWYLFELSLITKTNCYVFYVKIAVTNDCIANCLARKFSFLRLTYYLKLRIFTNKQIHTTALMVVVFWFFWNTRTYIWRNILETNIFFSFIGQYCLINTLVENNKLIMFKKSFFGRWILIWNVHKPKLLRSNLLRCKS